VRVRDIGAPLWRNVSGDGPIVRLLADLTHSGILPIRVADANRIKLAFAGGCRVLVNDVGGH
jgi:hypothetical protein